MYKNKMSIGIGACLLFITLGVGVAKNTLTVDNKKEVDNKVGSITDDIDTSELEDDTLSEPYFPKVDITNNSSNNNKKNKEDSNKQGDSDSKKNNNNAINNNNNAINNNNNTINNNNNTINNRHNIRIPKYGYESENVFINTSNLNQLSINKILKDGKEINLNYIDGSINKDGGYLKFKEYGNYIIKFTGKDSQNKSITHEGKINVYPMIETKFSLTKTANKNEVVEIVTALKNTDTVEWTVFKDEKSIPLNEAFEGNLSNKGGKIKFKENGKYTLKTSYINEVGRKFEYSASINITDKKLDLKVEEFTHTDKKANVKLSIDKDSYVEWEIYNNKENKNILSSLNNNLSKDGGYVEFREEGTYTIKAIVKDQQGNVHEESKKIKVHPVLSVDFNMPKKVLINKDATISVVKNNKSLPIKWKITKNGANTNSYTSSLTDEGGKINFKDKGNYEVNATIKDSTGRDFSTIKKIAVVYNLYPNYNNAPTDPTVKVEKTRTAKNGKFLVNITANSTDADNDEITYEWEGKSENDYYTVGNHTVRVRAVDSTGATSEWVEVSFEVISNAPTKPIVNVEKTRIAKNGKFLVNITANSTDADNDEITYEWEGKSEDNYYTVGSNTVRVRAVDSTGATSEWVEVSFEVISNAPTKPIVNVEKTRTAKNGKFLVNIIANSTDADNDKITYEWEGKSADNYYKVGNNTVRVRAVDSTGATSEWAETKFNIVSNAPTTPVITRTPNGNSVAPNTPVTIKANSTDADGDKITYVWENRPSETSVYKLGKNVVRVKAVDSTGAESPWSAIVFFVADSNNGGGVQLTGPNSTILENGIEGATIVNYTFKVPEVSGHIGKDYGRVKGFNIKTKQWDQLDYVTATNGVYMSKKLNPGIYSKLEFYYYTNDECMYNKSNITYSVEYYFE